MTTGEEGKNQKAKGKSENLRLAAWSPKPDPWPLTPAFRNFLTLDLEP